jgi:hypothetical protein
MRQRGNRPIRQLVILISMTAPAGCAPTLDVVGVYFPGWLVSAITGVAASYGIVLWLGRRPHAAGLVDSGLFFVSLAVGIALAVWWVCFSGFWGGG